MNSRVVDFNLAGRQFDIVLAQSRLDISHREIARRQGAPVQPDANGGTALAVNAHIRDTVDGGDAILDEALQIVGHLFRALPVGIYRQAHHRVGIGIALDHLRFINFFGQLSPHPADGVAHIIGCLVNVAAKFKFYGRGRAPSLAGRGDGLDPGNSSHGTVDNFGNIGVDHFRRSPDIGGGNRHD